MESSIRLIRVAILPGLLVLWGTAALPAARAQNTRPTISAIAAQSTLEDTPTSAIPFTIGDAESATSALLLTGISLNPTLVPPANIVFGGGSDATRNATITPAPDANGSASISIIVSDGSLSATQTFTLTVTAVNDPPTISGALLGNSEASALPEGTNGVPLFQGVTIGDVDQGKPTNEVIQVTVYPGSTFSTFGSFQGTETIEASGTPSQVTTALRAARLNVNNNISSGSFQLSIVARDVGNVSVTNTATVYVVSVNEAPIIDAVLAPSQILDNQDVLPFFLSIEDPDPPVAGEQFVVIIEPINDTNFTFGALVPPRPQFTGTLAFVQAAVRTVGYRPVRDSVATSQVIQFRFRVLDGGGAEATDTVALTVLGINDPPSISGVALNIIRITDDPARPLVRPFTTVRVVDVDEGGQQQLRVTLSVDDPAMGSLVHAGLGLDGPAISFTNTAAQVTAVITNVVFRPNQRTNRLVGETASASLRIRVVDSLGAASEDNRTTLAITSVNGSPQIFFSGSLDFPTDPVLLPPSAEIRPFALVRVQDDDQTNMTLTVRLDDPAKGGLTNLGGFEGVEPGVYRLQTNHAEVTRVLTNLVFVLSPEYLFPANAPGGTTFTLQAVDAVLNTTIRQLRIVVQDEPHNRLVIDDRDDVYPADHPVEAERGRPRRGTLRRAVQDANNNDVITFALSQYPGLIRLDENLGPIELIRNLTFKGPGADLLILSGDTGGDGLPDTQLFRVHAAVLMEGLTLTQGRDRSVTSPADEPITGGAVYVGAGGFLRLRHCAVTDSRSTEWGGAIDVMEGQLVLEHCLVRGNRTDEARGQGGGAISLYTDLPCALVNTTFASNYQASANGYGGGAIYVENLTPSSELQVSVRHCTFAENLDAADLGSSISANAFGTLVTLGNSIFADGLGRNLEVQGAGRMTSVGGNVSDDSTRTTLLQAGQPKSIIILEGQGDVTDVETGTILEPLLDARLGPTGAYPLVAGSPAIGRALLPAEALDQRGVFRDADPDAGAMEYEAFERVVINEIHFNPNPALPGDGAFVEVYVPRDAVPVLLDGVSLWVDGTNRHVFAAGTRVRPGHGILVAERVITLQPTNNPTPVVVRSAGPLSLTSAGSVELRRNSQMLALARYNGVIADPNSPTNILSFGNAALTLAPQFRGFALVPHRTVLQAPPPGAEFEGVDLALTGPDTSPGKDTRNAAFGLQNAFPFAGDDFVVATEDDVLIVDARANDFDADRLDLLFIVDVSQGSAPGTGNAGVAASQWGAQVSIQPAGSPLRGTSLLFDPRTTTTVQRLAEGAMLTDTFYYELVDVGAGPILAFTNTSGLTTVVSPSHRLTNGEQVVISGAGVTAYNITSTVANITVDTFRIPVPFQTNPPVTGSWRGQNPRLGTVRDEAKVTLTVLGANDPPTPQPDQVATDEETILRLMADPILAGNNAVAFATDSLYPPPRTNPPVSLLPNDTDPDTDDDGATLQIVGVVGAASAITGYAGTSGAAPVVVRAPGHGLADGTEILISGYGGHPSYNGFHPVTVVDADTFSIPVTFVDSHTNAGRWAVLNDGNRLSATSRLGAAVVLEIRADRSESSVVYNPRASAALNALSLGQTTNDLFYYAVEDRHGAVSLAAVTVTVTGVNDAPVPMPDPSALAAYVPLLGGQSLAEAVAETRVVYFVAPDSGGTNRADVQAEWPVAGSTNRLWLADVWVTDELTPLLIPADLVLANDADVDQADELRLANVVSPSPAGAAVRLAADGQRLTYDPSDSTRLNALAREELWLDTIEVTVSDGRGGAVTALLAILVVGINDTPVAHDDSVETFRNAPLSFNPVRHPVGDPAMHDHDDDIDGNAPDDRLVMIPVSNAPTAVPGARVTIAGESLTYNPTNAPWLSTLPLGETWVDAFTYTVVDSSFLFANDDRFKVAADGEGYALAVLANDRNLARTGRSILGFAGTPGQSPTTVTATNHGLTTGMTVAIAEYGGNGLYNRTHAVSVLDQDTFTIPVPFADDGQPKGTWTRLRVVGVTAPGRRGAVQIDASASAVLYTPEVNFVGTDTFTYTIEDSEGLTDSGVVTVQVIVDQLNGNLQANDDFFAVAKGQAPLLDALANDAVLPATGAALTITRLFGAAAGQAAIVGNQIRYTPAAAAVYPHTATFSYEISGGGTARATAEVTIHVVDREGTLAIRGDAFSVGAGTVDNALDVLANDNILPGSVAVLRIQDARVSSAPARGAVSATADGTLLLYTPAAGFVGQEQLTYVASDGLGGTGTGTVSVAVGALAASPDYFVVSTNAVTDLDVAGNDLVLQSGGGIVTVQSVFPAVTIFGSVTVQTSNNRLRFVSGGLAGETNLTYVITDGGGWATGRVTVVVFDPGAGEEVHASPDYFSVLADSSATLLDVLTNDVAIPNRGRALTVVSIGTGVNAPNRGGSVLINDARDGLLYTPASGFRGEETFTYTVTDSRKTDTTKVVVKVSSGDLLANNDAYTVFFEVPGNGLGLFAAGDLRDLAGFAGQLRQAPDEVSQWLTNQLPTSTRDRLAAYAGGSDPELTAALVADLNTVMGGPLIFDAQRFAAVTLTVDTQEALAAGPVGTAVVRANRLLLQDAYPDLLARPEPVAFTLSVLANDRVLPDLGQLLTITGVGIDDINATNAPSRQGSVFVDADGSALRYQPRDAAGPFPYVEHFTYEISDGSARRAEASVEVTVERRIHARDLETSDDAYSVQAESADNRLAVLANDNVKPASATNWIITGTTAPSYGGQLTVGGGALRYRPAAGFVGTETFTYFVSDGLGGTGEGRVTVKVGDEPLCPDRFAVVSGSVGNELDVLANDAVRPGTAADYLLVAAGGTDRNGTVAVQDGVVLYTPDAGYAGDYPYLEMFDYVVQDDSAMTVIGRVSVVVHELDSDRATAVVRVSVHGINDPPVITGTVAGQRVYHRGSLRPFSAVTLTDRDLQAQQPLTVTLIVNDPSHGVFAALGQFVSQGGGIYVLGNSGAGVSPAAATEALRNLIFQPTTAARLAAGESEETLFAMLVSDSIAPAVMDANTSVIAYHPQVDLLTPSDRINLSEFGYAVAATRDLVVVGAPKDSRTLDSGSVYLYARTLDGSEQWSELRKLTSPDPNAGDEFGCAVAISGDWIAVGARFDDQRAVNAGAVYLFGRNQGGAGQWGFMKKIMAADGAAEDQFGLAVALSGETLAIGSVFDDDRGLNSGSAYIHVLNQGGAGEWGLVKKLIAPDGAADDQFALKLALNGSRLAVSAPFDDDRGINSGAVLIFSRDQGGANQWGFVQKLLAADGAAGDHFGIAVALAPETLVVGAELDDGTAADVGSAYVFTAGPAGNNWSELKKLVPADGAATDRFGAAVAVEHDYIAVGAPQDDDTRADAGSIYIFERHQGGTNQWGQLEKLTRAGSVRHFGDVLALGGASLAVGAEAFENGNWQGMVVMHRLRFYNAPYLAVPAPDQVIPSNVPFAYGLPAETFATPDARDVLTYAASAVGGAALPAWLQFDPASRTFTGTPPPSALGTVSVEVVATDEDGQSASDRFDFIVMADGYTIWQRKYFTLEELLDPTLELTRWGDLANPDFDALNNRQEFEQRANPLNGDSLNGAPAATNILLSLEPGPAPQQLTLRYVRSVDPAATCSLLVSADLLGWLPGDVLVESETLAPLAAGLEAVTLTLRVDGLAGRAHFFRIVVNR